MSCNGIYNAGILMQKRCRARYGLRGERIGEASHPGPTDTPGTTACPGCTVPMVRAERVPGSTACSICGNTPTPGGLEFICDPCGTRLCRECAEGCNEAQLQTEVSELPSPEQTQPGMDCSKCGGEMQKIQLTGRFRSRSHRALSWTVLCPQSRTAGALPEEMARRTRSCTESRAG